MQWYKDSLLVPTSGKGMHDITRELESIIAQHQVQDGICHLFVQHTSASLVLSENWDPSAREDMETYMDRLVPENQKWMKHTTEGMDDSPAHIRTMLGRTSESIPIEHGKMLLGQWQGIYLFEHRTDPHKRHVILRILSADATESIP
jgi:secondary thiamine-phosphate synthase enzyme